jgi:Mu transposase, C-terminal domain/Plasmid pRiA4b ORF-3-like protein
MRREAKVCRSAWKVTRRIPAASSQARVNIDYHVQCDRHFYSVPYTLTGRFVEIRSAATTLEIFHHGQRVASRARSHQPYQATTFSQHRPKSHQQHLAWPPSRLVRWAQSVGTATVQLFAEILQSKPHPEMGYRSCLGILRLDTRYTIKRLEAAARRAVSTGACSYPGLKSISVIAGGTTCNWKPSSCRIRKEPILLSCRRAPRPTRSCGGSSGYEDYLEAIADPEHEEHENVLRWWGPFDPGAFSLMLVNQHLQRESRSATKPAAPDASPS